MFRPLLLISLLLFGGCGSRPAAGADLAQSLDLATVDLTVIEGVVCGPLVRCATCAEQFCDTADYGVSGTCRAHTSPQAQMYACDGPEDCPGNACCQTVDGSACSAFGFCVSGSVKGQWMCHSQPDCGPDFFCCPVAPGSPYQICLDHPC